MDERFIRERITELRIKKGVSEYKMSLDLGHSRSYIQSISSGRAMPSMTEFIYICEYLGITPKEFFDTDTGETILLHELLNSAKTLSANDLSLLIELSIRLNNKN